MRKLTVLAISLAIMIVAVYISKLPQDQPRQPDSFVKILPKEQLPPLQKETTFEQAINDINENDVKAHMDFLCSQQLEGRMSGKEGNKQSASYIEKQFQNYGLQTKRQKFPISKANPGPKNESGDDYSENIIGWIDGQQKDEIMVVGAHMDHIGYGPQWSSARGQGLKIHPGADDNASGTTGLLEIAKAHGKVKSQIKRTTIFIAFSGEEMGLVGSRYYCNNPLFPISSPSIAKHVFMLNMDMIGRLSNRQTYDTGDIKPDLRATVSKLSGKYSFASSITSSGSGGSDHASFAAKGVPVCILHTGQHPQYHTPQDGVNTIDFAGLTKIAKYATELAWNIGQGDKLEAYGPVKSDQDHNMIPFKEK